MTAVRRSRCDNGRVQRKARVGTESRYAIECDSLAKARKRKPQFFLEEEADNSLALSKTQVSNWTASATHQPFLRRSKF